MFPHPESGRAQSLETLAPRQASAFAHLAAQEARAFDAESGAVGVQVSSSASCCLQGLERRHEFVSKSWVTTTPALPTSQHERGGSALRGMRGKPASAKRDSISSSVGSATPNSAAGLSIHSRVEGTFLERPVTLVTSRREGASHP
jgi:hypothetical protein